MSTRSIVFARTESGIKGVYVHWDGHPRSRLAALDELIQRDGVSKVVSTLLGKPNGWSQIYPNHDGVLHPWESDGRFLGIPGYGVQYTDTPVPDPLNPGQMSVQADTKYRTTDSVGGDSWEEYVYIIEESGQVAWAVVEGDWGDLVWMQTVPA